MPRPEVRELGEGRLLIDLHFRDTEGLVASYAIPGEDGWTLVETGPTTCLPFLLEGVRQAGIEPEQVARILVTHIHLDHAGGLGAAARSFPRARLMVHARGAPHMVDPTKLIASARRAWGAAADPLWGAIEPVPVDRLVPLSGGESIPVRGGELRVVATPGHAQHHLAFLDTCTRSVLTGDAAGVRLEGARCARPAIPPPDLDLAALFGSLDAMAALDPRRVLYSHFGPSETAVQDLRRYRDAVTAWRDAALAAARTDPSVAVIAAALRAVERRRGDTAGASAEANELISGYDLAAQGLLRYFTTHSLLPG
jgi:glyoxylase-like metal-dependent hydrolase (beta-lactamase superfamily II)